MHHDVTEIFQTLTKAGAIPGSDFSIDPVDGSLRMNETSYNLLNHLYPEVDWEDVTAIMEPDVQDVIDRVQEHLGIDFTERLVKRIHERLSDLPPAQATWYLSQLLGGVQRQTGI
ncbi:MAG: hypothetical protein F6K16_38800, partial [Symploca sp. SIO2B6]|nr:hypothetical protein [Symploca sp. SIO2B6]